MEALPKSQLAKILLFLLLLLLTTFIPTSLRPSYLYFLFNILIIALGVEAGFLNAISGPPDEKKSTPIITSMAVQALPDNGRSSGSVDTAGLHEGRAQPVKPVEKPKVEKVAAVAKIVQKVKRCPSKPSIFFIGGFDGEAGLQEEEEEKEEEEGEEVVVVGELSKQELFAKAETFIGNFYKQLKMQREDSWKKIHGLYNRAF
ncbi:uncharacterized protein [Elaeis guineensis]|uniref:Uncharacterized protein LOC105044958 n=1 Tax=Elaeis guineensis var. tenera TaxID=51953 RepID=A0A6I9R6T9_ELAGV|nr:uncharacterized protein LOC105044958 [Elaeis guineensis]